MAARRRSGPGEEFPARFHTGQLGRGLSPAGDLQDRPVATYVVLDAHVEVLPRLAEEPAGPLSGRVVECPDPDATVSERVDIRAVVEAAPEVVVRTDAGRLRTGGAVLVEDPVPTAGLVGDVVGHVDRLRALDEQLDLRCSRAACRRSDRAVRDADRLAPVEGGVGTGVVPAEANVARREHLPVDVEVFGAIV